MSIDKNTTPMLAPLNEIVGCLCAGSLSDTAKQSFKSDAKAFIQSQLNVSISDSIFINIAENDADTVHLVLPYYESVDSESTRMVLADMDLGEVVGGEIIISILVGATAGALVGAAVGGSITSAAVGGVVGAVVLGAVATAATGAAVGTLVNNSNGGGK